MLRKILVLIGVGLILNACKSGLSPEQQAQVQALRAELDATRKEVVAAEAKDAKYSGGVVKAFSTLHIEILKTNEALLLQRIQAIESGAQITVQVSATNPDSERAKKLEEELAIQETKVTEALSKANASKGGLVGAMAHVGSVTEENTLALLRQQYLIAKYGLANLNLRVSNSESATSHSSLSGKNSDTHSSDEKLKFEIISPTLTRKQYFNQNYQDSIWFDVKFDAIGLDKPARAIKGALILTDLFDEPRFSIRWTIDKPIVPGGSYTEKGSGFDYNQFINSHHWVKVTEIKDMKVKFRVDNILYEDGTSREL